MRLDDETMDRTKGMSQPPTSCPCCTFLPDDLFLPNNLKTDRKNIHEDAGDPGEIMLTPQEALKDLQQHHTEIVLVDTHGHVHLERESQPVYQLTNENEAMEPQLPLISLTCAVQESDWEACLEYASRSPHCRAALGVHPWYLKGQQQQAIEDENQEDDDSWLQRLEALLQKHAGVLVGEVGLCKMARWVRQHDAGKGAALQWQRRVLRQQLELAAKYQRPVTIHCVQQQGVFLELLQELTSSSNASSIHQSLPPAMAMHSFSGTAHQVQALLKWEESLYGTANRNNGKKKKENRKKTDRTQSPNTDADESNQKNTTSSNSNEVVDPPVIQLEPPRNPLLYFGFSRSINYAMCSSEKSRRQGVEAICAIPFDRLLVESDVHSTDNVMLGTTGALAYVAWALERPLMQVVHQTQVNALRFLSSLPDSPDSSR